MDKETYIAVLHKLHHIVMHGLPAMEEGGRYVFTWDTKKSMAQNKALIALEDAALKYFLDIGAVDGERVRNEFRQQRLWGQQQTPPINVWANWNDVDNAYREYEWSTFLYGINNDKFQQELERFGLANRGLELEVIEQIAKSSPISSKFGLFATHKDGSISYGGTPLKLKRNARLLVHAFVQNKGAVLRYESIVDTLWNEESGTITYLENPRRTQKDIKKRIGNIVSETNEALYTYGNKKHIVPMGETSYKLVA